MVRHVESVDNAKLIYTKNPNGRDQLRDGEGGWGLLTDCHSNSILFLHKEKKQHGAVAKL